MTTPNSVKALRELINSAAKLDLRTHYNHRLYIKRIRVPGDSSPILIRCDETGLSPGSICDLQGFRQLSQT